MQGATLDRGLYHAGDRSSFEEGYVALTRARVETRVYLVDGTAAVNEDDAHEAHASEPAGLDTVARAMERRRAETPAIELDPNAAAAGGRYGSRDLRSLRIERQRLESLLGEGPADMTGVLADTCARRDALLARRQAWTANQVRPPVVVAQPTAIERQLEAVERRLDLLNLRQNDRRTFLDAHREQVAELRLIGEAELARTMQVRIEAGAQPDASVLAVLGPRPMRPADRQTWSNAVERVAVHRERWGVHGSEGSSEGDLTERILGEPPTDARALLSYKSAANAIHRELEAELEPSLVTALGVAD